MAGCHVLVVEDEPDIVLIIRLVLEAAGHTMEAVETLGEARTRLAAAPPPGLVILDRRLPDGDGLDLVREVGRHAPPIPVLMLSAVVSAEDSAAAIATGATRVMAKPFEIDALEAVVDELCATGAAAA
jgi:DNA-binding response OmpR family regulator